MALMEDQNLANSYRSLDEAAAIVELPEVRAIELRGDDRKGWLQGQATNDLRELHPGGSARFCLCSPTGQLLAICGIWSLPDRFLITTDASAMPALLERIERMVILEDVVARDLSDSHGLISVQGPDASEALRTILDLPALDCADSPSGVSVLRDDRTGRGGWTLAVPRSDGQIRAALAKLLPVSSSEGVEVVRLEAGIPAFGRDTTPKTLPPEMGRAFVERHVSYNKGCYTGQEVIMRIHSRGHTNRTWVGLVAKGPVEPGALIESGGQQVGVVTSASVSPRLGPIAAAMIRNEFAVAGTEVDISGVSAEVRDMPLLERE